VQEETFPFFTPCVPGLEPFLQRELWTLGIHPLTEEGGFFWKGTWRDFYRAHLLLRGAGRILVRMASFEALTFADWEQLTSKLPWFRFVQKGKLFKLKITAAKCGLYHEDALAERLAAVIEAATGASWAQQASDADAQIFLARGWRDRFVISADGTGEHLHRRGYRQELSKAPLRETVAAALLQASGWLPAVQEGTGRGRAARYKAPAHPLLDPFCGSGTIVIEAALMARKIPPAMANPARTPRAFNFLRWPGFQQELWDKTISSLQNHILERSPLTLSGSDRNDGAVASALANAQRAGVENDVVFERHAFSDAAWPAEKGFVVTNPPFGVRVSESSDLRDLYASWGRLTAEKPDLIVAWLCSSTAWERATGRRWEKLAAFPNGGMDLSILWNPGKDQPTLVE